VRGFFVRVGCFCVRRTGAVPEQTGAAVVPFAAGSATDSIARVVAQALIERLASR